MIGAVERDRPSLGMPKAQSVIDVLATFGWRQSRPDPVTVRDSTLTPLQPLILANGTMAHRVTVLSEDSAITAMCLDPKATVASVTQDLYAAVLCRPPTAQEKTLFGELLGEGFETRVVKGAVAQRPTKKRQNVSWSNHFSVEATRIKMEQERQIRQGDTPTVRLTAAWRERAEDALWALINSPEFLFVP